MADLADTAQAYDAMGTALPSYTPAPQPTTVKDQLDAVGIPSTPSQPQQPDPATPLPAPPGDTASVPGEASPVGNLGLMTKPGGGIASPNAGGLGNQPAPPPAQAPVDNPQGIYGAGAPPGPRPDLFSAAPSPASQTPPTGLPLAGSGPAPAPPGPGQVPGSDDTQGAAPAGSYNAPGSPPAQSSGQFDQGAADYSKTGTNRGQKNNNPLNLSYVENQPFVAGSDGRFGTYPNMQAGVAATARQLELYGDSGTNTVRKAVTRWVSDPKADLTSYIADVAKSVGVDPDAPVDFKDPNVTSRYIMAAYPHESGGGGIQLSQNDVNKGVQVGLNAHNWTPSSAVQIAQNGGTPPVGGNSSGDVPRASVPLAPTPAQQHELSSVGLPAQAYQGNPWFALASGLMGKRSLGEGMSAGFGNLNAMGQQNFENQMKLGQYGIENKRMDNQMAYQNAMVETRNRPQPFGAPVNMGTAEAPNWMQQIKHSDGSTSFTQTGAPASNTTANQKPELAATQTNLQTQTRQANADVEEMHDAAHEARIKAPLIDNAVKLAASGQASTGPGLAELRRNVAQYFGVNVDGADPEYVQKMQQSLSQIRGSGIMGKNMRTQREFDTVMQGLPTMAQGGPALMGTLNAMKNINALKTQTDDAFMALDKPTQQMYRQNPDAQAAWVKDRDLQWSNGVSKQGGIMASPQDGQPAQGQPASTGKPTLRYDQASGQMVPNT